MLHSPLLRNSRDYAIYCQHESIINLSIRIKSSEKRINEYLTSIDPLEIMGVRGWGFGD